MTKISMTFFVRNWVGKYTSYYLGNVIYFKGEMLCSIFIHDVYVDLNIPVISYSPKCYYGHLWDLHLVVCTLMNSLTNNHNLKDKAI